MHEEYGDKEEDVRARLSKTVWDVPSLDGLKDCSCPCPYMPRLAALWQRALSAWIFVKCNHAFKHLALSVIATQSRDWE